MGAGGEEIAARDNNSANEPGFRASYDRFLAAMGRFEQGIQELGRARKLANGPMFNLSPA
jgi:hypothetical protein